MPPAKHQLQQLFQTDSKKNYHFANFTFKVVTFDKFSRRYQSLNVLSTRMVRTSKAG